MNSSLPSLFGKSFHEITQNYLNSIGLYLSPVFHISAFFIIILTIIIGIKNRKAFTLYFLLNYLWIFIYVGLYMTYLFYEKMGFASLMFWGMMPILLFMILFYCLRELKDKKNNLNFRNTPLWRLIIIPVIIFGFWYPTFIYGKGFKIVPEDLLFSFYGLMPCPTTMVLLGLLTLKYPDVNKGLFFSMTAFAVMVGTAQIFISYIPDYPLAFIGYYSIILIIINKIKLKTISN